MTNWSIPDIPTQSGKLAVVTGSTGGLGFQTAFVLAQTGAEVVLTGRNDAKGHAAMAKIQSRFPAAKISYETLDLASLASVAAFAQRFAAAHLSLDLLINNAGVMALPTRQTTTDGFEMQFGTNYLGHYALTAQLLPLLRRGHEPRVVNLQQYRASDRLYSFQRSARRTSLFAVEGLQPVETRYADVRARTAAPERRWQLEFDE